MAPAPGPTDDAPAPVLCIGEAMVAFGPTLGTLATCDDLQIFVAGAEANVAAAMAHLGHHVEWFGHLGDDPFGLRVREFLHDRGVATSGVVIEPDLPTGLYFKDRVAGLSTMYYYRSGSAATGMTLEDVPGLRLPQRRLVHLSGITAALSSGCDALVEQVLATAAPAAVSFDVNFRSKLWPVDVAAPRILALARRAAIVLVGRDEAEMLWGTATPAAIWDLFPNAESVVVKDSHIGATEFRGGTETFVPAPRITVVEPIGAGDAFAAGYLAARLDGADAPTCLRLGHVLAAQALSQAGDSPTLLPATDLRALTDPTVGWWP